MINKVTIIGRIGQNPEIKTLEGGAKVAKFSVATDESYKDQAGEWQKKTEWINVLAWRMLSDKVQNQVKKGTLIYIEGKITTRSYVKNDETRYVTEVVANAIRTLKDGIQSAGYLPGEEDAPPPYRPKPEATATAVAQLGADAGAGTELEDLPF